MHSDRDNLGSTNYKDGEIEELIKEKTRMGRMKRIWFIEQE